MLIALHIVSSIVWRFSECARVRIRGRVVGPVRSANQQTIINVKTCASNPFGWTGGPCATRFTFPFNLN